MAQKDVKFVISARDEATKTFEAVVDALKEMKAENLSAGESADKAGSLMSEFAREVSALSKELSALKGAEKMAKDLDKANKAVARMDEEVKKTADDLAKVNAEMQKATQAVAKYKAEVAGIQATLGKERESLKNLNAERARANRELQKAETAYKRVEAASKKANPLSTRGKTIASALTFAKGDVDSARAEVDRLSNAIEAQKATVATASAELKKRSSALAEAARAEKTLDTQVTNLNEKLTKSRKAVTESKDALNQMGQTAQKTGAALGNLAMTQEKIAERERQITESRARMVAEQEALARYANQKGGFTDPETTKRINDQVALVKRLKTDYETLAGTAQRLANNMKMIGPPTADASVKLREAAGAAAAAKREYEAQLRVLNQMPGAVSRVNGIRGLFGGIYGDSRKAMSMMQRLRGEVLSLTTAYLGLYGTMTNIGGVITSYQQLEAAQNRLGAIFNQNEAAVTNELKFIETQAGRLGIQFGVLSDQYSKFSVAARAANFTTAETRKVFLSVAEAGRVNKLSMEQMEGIFLALEQMISKGKVASEELRRQMGDRLPGAFNIMADALGMTTEELDDLMKKGQVLANSENMLKFAEELDRRFGGQLAKSLTSTTTLLGKFSNEIYQAQLIVANNGFIDAFNRGLEEMIRYFQSREGRDFFLSLSAALGNLVTALSKVPQYFGLISTAIKVFISYKLTEAVWGMASAFVSRLVPALAATRTNFALTLAGVRAFSMGLTTLSGVLGSVGIALRGIPGVALFAGAMYAIQFLIERWITGVDDVTRSADEHERIMQRVREAYEGVKTATDDWGQKIKDVTVDQANKNLRDLIAMVEQARTKLTEGIKAGLRPGDFSMEPLLKDLVDLIWKTRDGKKSFKEYREELEELYKAMKTDKGKAYVEMLLEVARKHEETEKKMREAAQAALALGSDMKQADEIAKAFGDTMTDLVGPIESGAVAMDSAAESAKKYAEALAGLAEHIPELKAKLKEAESIAEIEANFQQGIDNLGNSRGSRARLKKLVEQRDAALMNVVFDNLPESAKKAAALLVNKEGFRETPYWDTNAYRIGFGSDTVTLADGTVKKVVQGMQITRADAYRDLARRIEEFNKGIVRQIGPRFKQFSDEQQAALTSIAYNYGSLPERLVKVINKDDVTTKEIADAIRALGGDNNGINRQRRNDEAALFEGGADPADLYKEQETRLKNEQKIQEELQKQSQAVRDFIESKQFELKQNEMIEKGLGRQAAIEEAIREARRMKKDLTEEEVQAIADITGKLWDQKNATEGIQKAEEEISRLQSLRSELMQQIEFHEGQGDLAGADALKQRLTEVNDQLRQAIANTIAMYQAHGGPDSELAIARLQNIANGIADIGQKAVITGKDIAERLSGVLSNAFKSMAQAIAEGEDAWEAFSNAFLQGIADMLIELGELIIRYAILNALQGFMGGLGIPMGRIFHEGGVVGVGSGPARPMAGAWLANAVRYHKGGIAGLKPGEVPAILEEGEEVLTRDDPRHIANGGGVGSPAVNLRVVNAFDAGEVVSEGLSSPAGEQTFINMVKRNAKKINQALGS